MGLFSFIQNAGKKIFGSKEEEEKKNPGVTEEQLHQQQMQAIRQHVMSYGINIKNLDVRYTALGEITITGEAATLADYEKAALMAGNIMGISKVDNNLTIAQQPATAVAPKPSRTHTVEKGDTLWAIAEKTYGNGSKYQLIVEANQPMIKDADEIYPGQVLRLPEEVKLLPH